MPKIYHNPPHLRLDQSIYIVTSCTYHKIPHFNSNEKKKLLQDSIFNAVERVHAELYAWVILCNHYHILFKLMEGKNLGLLIKFINGSSARELNKIEKKVSRKIWYNYWDTCIRNEEDFYVRLNYIHNNPIKHGYINNLDDLGNYQFSSYPGYLKEKGVEWLIDSFRRYPTRDFIEKGEP